MNPTLPLALLLAVSPPALAKRIDVVGATASSVHPDEGDASYEAARAHDGKLGTAWVEGRSGSGLGEWVELDLGSERRVHKLKVWGGMCYSRGYWKRANRPKEIEVQFSDGSTEMLVLDDEMEAVELLLSGPKTTSSVRLTVRSVYPGTTWLETPISQVQVFDADPGDSAEARSVKASSVKPTDADGLYAPDNVVDGLSDSMWCEASEGDGTDEWIDLDLSGSPTVGTLTLINGNASALKWWMQGNRATAATLAFSDGSTEDIAIKNTMMPQEIAFTPRATSKVRITFTEVAKGREVNELCISEVGLR